MKQLKTICRAFAPSALLTVLVLLTACSSDTIIDDMTASVDESQFVITVSRTKNAGNQNSDEPSKAPSRSWYDALTRVFSSSADEVYMVSGMEDINPPGWNDPLDEAYSGELPVAKGPNKTQYSHDPLLNYLSVRWKAGDKIGIKTAANAASGSASWTQLTLTQGDGNTIAEFSGLASATNGLSPTGSQDIVAVYPYNATGTYNFATQPGLISSLGDYDVRIDEGTLVNANVTDLYFRTKISVVRIDKTFFDMGAETKTRGKSELTVTIHGAGIGNRLTGVCSNNEAVTAGNISATVSVDPSSGKPLEDVFLAFVPIDTNDAEFHVQIQSGSDANTYSEYLFYKSHFQVGMMYNLKHPGSDISEQCIDFVDPKVEAILVQNFDTNRNGCISYREARCITYLGTAFENTSIERFPEFELFTNIRYLSTNSFSGCTALQEIHLPAHLTIIEDNVFKGCSNLSVITNIANITTVGNDAFSSCTSLTTADFPVCTTVGNAAFSSCTSLTTADFPVCTTVGNDAFSSCTSLTTADFPVCTTVGNAAFSSCTSLTTADFPVCTTVGNDAFSSCTSLTTADFPVCTTVGSAAFRGCEALTSVSFPVCTTVDLQAFDTCTSLTTADFPVCTTVGDSAFRGCEALTSVSFPVCTTVGNSAFRLCKSLRTGYFPKCTSIGSFSFLRTALTQLTLKTGCTGVSDADIPTGCNIIYVP